MTGKWEKKWTDGTYDYNENDVYQSADGKTAYANASDAYDNKPVTDTYGSTEPQNTWVEDENDSSSSTDDSDADDS